MTKKEFLGKDEIDFEYVSGVDKGKRRLIPVKKIKKFLIKDFLYMFKNNSIQMSKIQRNFRKRPKDFEGFMSKLISMVVSFNEAEELRMNDIIAFEDYSDSDIIRILDGQHRIKWIFSFIYGEEGISSFLFGDFLKFTKKKIFFNDLPKDLQEKFLNMVIVFKIFDIKNRSDEIYEFEEINNCSIKLNRNDKIFAEQGYSKNSNVFKDLIDYQDCFNKKTYKLYNAESISNLMNPGSTVIVNGKNGYLSSTKIEKFLRNISYCLNLDTSGDIVKTIGNLINATEVLTEEETITLLNNFSQLFYLMEKSNNSDFKYLLNCKGTYHGIAALLKSVYDLVLTKHGATKDTLNLFSDKELSDSFDETIFAEKAKIIANLHKVGRINTTTQHSTSITNEYYKLLEK